MMTNNQHTPGPWCVTHPYGEPGTYIEDPRTTALIAKVYTTDGITVDCGDTEANARLIAAAPYMLSVLELIAASRTSSAIVLRRYARDAIANATGGDA
jgi:hypothetical protein